MLYLRTSDLDGRGRRGFPWPVRGRVEMRPGNWFGGFRWALGNAGMLHELRPEKGDNQLWQVVAVDPADMLGYAARAGEVVYSGDRAGALDLLAACAPAGMPIPWTSVEVGDAGIAVTGTFGNSVSGRGGWSVTGERGSAVSGPGGQCAAGAGGTLTLTCGHGDGLTRTFRVGGEIAPLRFYSLRGDGVPVAGAQLVFYGRAYSFTSGGRVVRLVTTLAGEQEVQGHGPT